MEHDTNSQNSKASRVKATTAELYAQLEQAVKKIDGRRLSEYLDNYTEKELEQEQATANKQRGTLTLRKGVLRRATKKESR